MNKLDVEFRLGDIILVNMSANATGQYEDSVSHQQLGIRYAVIISNNIGNAISPILTVVPCTSSRKKFIDKQPTHAKFYAGEIEGLSKDSTFVCENTTVIDKFQVLNKVGKMTKEQLTKIAFAKVYSDPIVSLAFENGITETEKYKYIMKA